jgi:hypothetical protein
LVLQAGIEFELDDEGLAIFDLIAHIAYNSAFLQLRTKEQLGYIVSLHPKKNCWWFMGHVNRGTECSVALPEVLETRCESWLELFRKELDEMEPDSVAREASAVAAQLLETETKISQEVSRVWGEILSTEGLVDRLRTPKFDRVVKLAQELIVIDDSISGKKTSKALKERVLEFFDLQGKPGILSSYSDMRYVKQFLGSIPSVPYWRKCNLNDNSCAPSLDR